MNSRARTWNKKNRSSFSIQMWALIAIVLVHPLAACRTREPVIKSSLLEEHRQQILEEKSLSLFTFDGKAAASMIQHLAGALYIGKVGFTSSRSTVSPNSSFFEEESLQKILSELPTSKETSGPNFRLVGCKKRNLQLLHELLTSSVKEKAESAHDLFFPKYAKVWQTELLDSSVEDGCVRTLQASSNLHFEFYLKPESDENSKSVQKNIRQLLIVRGSGDERSAVFESIHEIPQGNVLVILRNDSWGKSKPQIAILPAQRDFNSEEQKQALYALGWTGTLLRELRFNSGIANWLTAGKPINLSDLSARFHAIQHYMRMADVGLRSAESVLIPAGLLSAYGALASLTQAVYAAQTTHSLTYALSQSALTAVSGLSSATKAFCDVARIQKLAESSSAANKPNITVSLVARACAVADLALASTSAVQLAFDLEIVKQALTVAFQASVGALSQPWAQVVDTELRKQFFFTMERFQLGLDKLFADVGLTFTSLPLARVLLLEQVTNILGNTHIISEHSAKIHGTFKMIGSFWGLDYGRGLSKIGYRCPNAIDIQWAKFGRDTLIKRMLMDSQIHWEGCFAFLREVYEPQSIQKDSSVQGLSQSDDFWSLMADKLNALKIAKTGQPGSNQTATEPIELTSPDELKMKFLSPDGPVFFRSKEHEPWNKPESTQATFARFKTLLFEDIERCATKIQGNVKICKNQGHDCLHKCTASALHKLRNEYMPLDYISCLEDHQNFAAKSWGCTVEFDNEADDLISMRDLLTLPL